MKHLSILVPDEQTNMSTIACIVGTYQVFSEANKYGERKGAPALYQIELVGANQNDCLNNDFLSIQHQSTIRDIKATDLIIIPATLIRSYETATTNNQLLIDWISKQYKHGAEIASMCAGSFMLAAQQFIEENYTDKISMEKLSADLRIGRRNFDRRFTKATGLTPLDYLQRVKIEAAKKKLETTRKTVHEVMYEVGYNDAKAFRDVFSRITGLSPLEYKSKYNKEGRLLVR